MDRANDTIDGDVFETTDTVLEEVLTEHSQQPTDVPDDIEAEPNPYSSLPDSADVANFALAMLAITIGSYLTGWVIFVSSPKRDVILQVAKAEGKRA